MAELIESLLERDGDAIRLAIAERVRESSPRQALEEIVRFGFLAFAPSQHGIASLVSLHAADEMLDHIERPEALIAECGVYVSRVRQPWSEAPITDPPQLSAGDTADAVKLGEAVEARDRLAAERWLARALEQPDGRRRFFGAAVEDPGDTGQKLVVATTAWSFSLRFPPQYRFAALRAATATWVAAPSQGRRASSPADVSFDEIFEKVARRYVEADGSPLAFQPLLELDAALRLEEWGEKDLALRAVSGIEAVGDEAQSEQRAGRHPERREGSQAATVSNSEILLFAQDDSDGVVYELARDFGCVLQVASFGRRWKERFGGEWVARIAAAARHNLENAPSFADWTFA